MVVSVRSPIRRLHAQFIDTKRLKALVLILGGPGKFGVINKRITVVRFVFKIDHASLVVLKEPIPCRNDLAHDHPRHSAKAFGQSPTLQ